MPRTVVDALAGTKSVCEVDGYLGHRFWSRKFKRGVVVSQSAGEGIDKSSKGWISKPRSTLIGRRIGVNKRRD